MSATPGYSALRRASVGATGVRRDVEWLGDDGGHARHRASDEALERSDGFDMFENGATAHGILETRSFESSENECSDARLETGAWALRRRSVSPGRRCGRKLPAAMGPKGNTMKR